MSSRVYTWARSLRRDRGTSLGTRLHEASQSARHMVGRLALTDVDAELHDIDGNRAEPAKPLAELVRHEEAKLVQRVFLSPASDAPRTVLFAGVDHDNGSAHVCLRVGHALTRLTPRSVCVVDADLRAPKLQTLVGADAGEGLAEAIAHPEAASSFARRLAPENLWLVAAGSANELDSLVSVDRMSACLTTLATRFEHVVINAPAIDLWAESMAVSRLVDGVVLVLRAHVTRREIVRHVMARLEDFDTPLLGIVLNDRTFPIPEAVYRLI